MKIHGVLYLSILFAFDTCDCKCDEYIIVLKETANPIMNFEPMKVTDAMNTLKSFHNSTEIYKLYNELDSFKDCILEMECKGYSTYCQKKIVVTNHGEHSEELTNSRMPEVFEAVNDTNVFKQRKSEHIENEDKSLYDLNLLYLNQNHIQNNTDRFDNHTQNTMLMICEYAENSCDDDDLNNYKNISNDNAFNETMKDLVITLTRDEGSVIQPIFTGFASQNFTTRSTKNTFLEVTFICKYKESTHCKRKINNFSEEIVSVPSNSINVYLKNDYIKHNTKIKYTGCERVSGETNNTFNIQCDARNFTYINQDVLSTLPNNSEHNETSNLHCQVTESYLSPKSVSQHGYNSLHFNDCYRNQNINNTSNNFRQQNLMIFLQSRRRVDNNTINGDVESNNTKVPFTSTKDKINMNEENLFKMHITTDKINNCSTNQLFSITEGQVIDKGKHFINEHIVKYDDVELKLLNCFNETYSFNYTNTYGQQSKLIIIFKNESDINKIDEELGEPSEAIGIILVCHQPYSDENEDEIDSNDKIVFYCESLAVNNDTTAEMNSSNLLPSVSTQGETIHGNKGNQSDVDIEKKNCSSNATENTTFCAPKCVSKNVRGCHNISISNINNKKDESLDENDLSSTNNLTIGSKKTNDSQSNGHDNLTIENGDSLDRIGLILLVSIAGTGLLMAFALRKFAKRGQYSPAPVREPQDLEETAF